MLYWFLKCLNWRLAPKLYRLSPEFVLGGLRMTCECVISLVTCVATIITTVIAVLSYLKDKKE